MFLIIFVLLLIPFTVGLYKLFEKTGEKGWKAIVPFLNFYTAFKLTKQPKWWTILFIFPGINLIMFGVLLNGLARAFGKKTTSEIAKTIFLFFIEIPKMGMDKNTVYTDPSTFPKVKKSKAREWTEAIIFAIVAVTVLKTYVAEPYKIPSSSMEETLLTGDFLVVSKLHYGIRPPQTPLYFPLTHNNFQDLPGGFLPFSKSFLDWWTIPYMRLFPISKVKNNDIVVFNFPANDTAIFTPEFIAHNYHDKVASLAYQMYFNDQSAGVPLKAWESYESAAVIQIKKTMDITALPVDRRSNYVKRCVAIPGDKLEIVEGQLFINDNELKLNHTAYLTNIHFKQNPSKDYIKKLEITKEDMRSGDGFVNANGYATWVLTEQQIDQMKKDNIIDSAQRVIFPKTNAVHSFPQHINYNWSVDNFGPITIPKKGETVNLTLENLPLYRTIIRTYEGHNLEIKDGVILIDGTPSTSYKFGMDYYFMMGDNRHNSADSRIWGFVPEDHIVGKALFIWMSTDDNSGVGFPKNIRWNRVFKAADN